MSYVIQVWDTPANHPAPATLEAASRQLDQLQQQTAQHKKFRLLALRLTLRYPCICSPRAEEIPESEWAWSDGPLDGKTDAAVFALGVNPEMLDAVLPFVVGQARLFGLNVMDAQEGVVYLANGHRLTVATLPTSTPKKNYDDVPTRAALEKIVFERLTPFLAEHGFKARKSDRSFKAVFPNGWHVLYIGSTDMWPLNVPFCLNVESRFHEVTNLVSSIAWPDKPLDQVKLSFTTSAGQPKWMDEIGPFQGTDKGYVVRSYSEIDGVIEHLLGKLQTRLLPILEQYKTISGLDQILNPDPVTDSVFFTSFSSGSKHIVTAYLAKNPRLEALCKEFFAQIAHLPKDLNRVVPTLKCIDYVRSRAERESPL